MIVLRRKHPDKNKVKSTALKWLGGICFFTAFILFAVTVIMTLPSVQKSLDGLLLYFDKVEYFIAGLNHFAAVLVILLFFAVKSFLPLVPLSVLFISSGLVFPSAFSVVLNAVGFGILVTVKYFYGKKFGGGNADKLVEKVEPVKRALKLDGNGNKLLLLLLRFLTFVPVNTVSRVYGTTDMKYTDYLVFSMLGFLPRLISWSVVGCNITNPFTFSFTVPIITLLIFSGASLIIADLIFNMIVKNNNTERNINNEDNRN